jgi:hypothetical protein
VATLSLTLLGAEGQQPAGPFKLSSSIGSSSFGAGACDEFHVSAGADPGPLSRIKVGGWLLTASVPVAGLFWTRRN